MITTILIYALFLLIGIVAGIMIAVAVMNERVRRGTLVYLDEQGDWKGCDKAWISLTGQLLYPDENMAEWTNEDERDTEG